MHMHGHAHTKCCVCQAVWFCLASLSLSPFSSSLLNPTTQAAFPLLIKKDRNFEGKKTLSITNSVRDPNEISIYSIYTLHKNKQIYMSAEVTYGVTCAVNFE